MEAPVCAITWREEEERRGPSERSLQGEEGYRDEWWRTKALLSVDLKSFLKLVTNCLHLIFLLLKGSDGFLDDGPHLLTLICIVEQHIGGQRSDVCTLWPQKSRNKNRNCCG